MKDISKKSMKKAIGYYLDWNERRIPAEDFCYQFGMIFKKEVREILVKRIRKKTKMIIGVSRGDKIKGSLETVGFRREALK